MSIEGKDGQGKPSHMHEFWELLLPSPICFTITVFCQIWKTVLTLYGCQPSCHKAQPNKCFNMFHSSGKLMTLSWPVRPWSFGWVNYSSSTSGDGIQANFGYTEDHQSSSQLVIFIMVPLWHFGGVLSHEFPLVIIHFRPSVIGYPLVNCCIPMENHHFSWENQRFPWAIFNSKL